MLDVAKTETGSRYAMLRSPSCKINMTSLLRQRSPNLHNIG